MHSPVNIIEPIVARNKTEAVCEALEGLARQVGPGGKLPTVQALCESLGVSRVTLDRAMGRLERQGTLVRKHGQGIFSAPVRVRTVGVLFGLDPFRIACSPFYHLLFDAIRRKLAEREHELEIYVDLAHGRDHLTVRRRLQGDIEAGRIQGLLLPASGREQWEWVRRQGVPFVGGSASWMDGYRVGYDWRQIIEQWVAELARRGCRRLGLISHPLSLQVMRTAGDAERRHFEQTMRRYQLPVESDLIFQLSLGADEFPDLPAPTYEEDGFVLGKQLAADPQRLPDGLIISDDMVARGVLTALARAGVRAGEHIQVATHTSRGSSTLIGFEQDLARVELDPNEKAEGMVEMLKTLMDGEQPKEEVLLIAPARAGENVERDVRHTEAI